jgi:deoxyribonuclease-4
MSNLNRRFGVHTSISGGIELSIRRAKDLGCNTAQIFSHNPRQWLIKEIPSDSILRFKAFRKDFDINPLFIHSSYLINLSSSRKDIIEKSIKLLISELDIADLLDVEYVILHTGSASEDLEKGRNMAIEALKMISKEKKWSSKLLLENTAGERGDISSKIKDIALIIDKTNSPLIGGIVIDTCHAFAAGYDIRSDKALSNFVKEIEDYIGLDRLKLIHLNDSKKGYNSHVDRHEHIGQGSIGIDGLKRFINHPALKDIPLILETPKKSDEDDLRNLKTLKTLSE